MISVVVQISCLKTTDQSITENLNPNLEQLKKEIENTLKTLIDASAVDAGNEDCLIDKILGPVRDGIRYLDDQALEHNDFYNRQAANMEVHSFDIEKILEFWKEKESSITKEYESSQILWNKYCGSKERKVIRHD